ncbi:MAG TPA: hypothetical protein VIM34_13815 [Burkholderiaceae bacterium]
MERHKRVARPSLAALHLEKFVLPPLCGLGRLEGREGLARPEWVR